MTRPSSSRDEDAVLVRECLAGSDLAWERLLRSYAGSARAAIRAALRGGARRRDEALEEELLADTFASLAADDAKVLRSFRGESSLTTFISVVASRRALRVIRDRMRQRRALEGRAAVEATAPREGEKDPAVATEGEEGVGVALAALGALEPADRYLLTLYYLDGRSYQEVATLTGYAATGVGTKIARARARLREALRRGDSADDDD